MVYFYPQSELFENFVKPDFEKLTEVILWGAGRIGGMAEYCLRKRGVKICAFCDTAKDKWGTEFCGYKVINPEQMLELYPDATVIISCIYYSVVYEELRKMGYENIYECSSLFLEIDFDEYDFWMSPNNAIRNIEMYMSSLYRQVRKENSVDQIYLNITTKCTLRCRDCTLFIPYVKNPCIYNSADIIEDLINVLNCLEHVRVVNFYGGEPLIHPDLAKMIRQLSTERRIDRISVITNGTIVPSDELLTAMKNESRIRVRISDYGALSSKKEEIIRLLEANHIDYEVTNYQYWDENSRIEPCNDSEEQLKEKFYQCSFCNYLSIIDRKAYICHAASAVNTIGALPPTEDNYVDLVKYPLPLLREKLFAYIERPKKREYIDACKYCSGVYTLNFEHKIPVAVQTKEKMELTKLY